MIGLFITECRHRSLSFRIETSTCTRWTLWLVNRQTTRHFNPTVSNIYNAICISLDIWKISFSQPIYPSKTSHGSLKKQNIKMSSCLSLLQCTWLGHWMSSYRFHLVTQGVSTVSTFLLLNEPLDANAKLDDWAYRILHQKLLQQPSRREKRYIYCTHNLC